ncbi:MAG: hypothetical protein EXX96DRAFT_640022 [Benjaminiella poitrasii]|nr:MAG: hypothetical protein EXX96DRAFT_640022 [Benjaminiella poitrasii]
MFPKISFTQLTLGRRHGGLGILDPAAQQKSLQLRWLLPLLHSNVLAPSSSTSSNRPITLSHLKPSTVLLVLYHSLLYYFEIAPREDPLPSTFDPRLLFLFPDLRPFVLNQANSPWSLLFASVDLLPTTVAFSSVVVSPVTCLSLLLSAVIVTQDNPQLSRTLLRYPCSGPYTIDADTGCLRPRTSCEFAVHRNLSKLFLRLVRSDQIKLQPFFIRSFILPQFAGLSSQPFTPVLSTTVDATPFLYALYMVPVQSADRLLSSRQYRRAALLFFPILSGSASSQSLIPASWTRFWAAPLTNSVRNVWFRLLHNKIPHRSLLHHLSPQGFPGPSCPICHASSETLEHFLFLCPPKAAVWQTI